METTLVINSFFFTKKAEISMNENLYRMKSYIDLDYNSKVWTNIFHLNREICDMFSKIVDNRITLALQNMWKTIITTYYHFFFIKKRKAKTKCLYYSIYLELFFFNN